MHARRGQRRPLVDNLRTAVESLTRAFPYPLACRLVGLITNRQRRVLLSAINSPLLDRLTTGVPISVAGSWDDITASSLAGGLLGLLTTSLDGLLDALNFTPSLLVDDLTAQLPPPTGGRSWRCWWLCAPAKAPPRRPHAAGGQLLAARRACGGCAMRRCAASRRGTSPLPRRAHAVALLAPPPAQFRSSRESPRTALPLQPGGCWRTRRPTPCWWPSPSRPRR